MAKPMATSFHSDKRKWPKPTGGIEPALVASVAGESLRSELKDNLRQFHHKFVMSTVYPLTRRQLGGQWRALVTSYLSVELPHLESFQKFGSSLSLFLAGDGAGPTASYPHLAELAEFEWTCFEIQKRQLEVKAKGYTSPRTTAELNSLGPAANPAMALRSYTFPIPAIANRLRRKIGLPEKVRPETTHLVIFKHPENSRLETLELSGIVARIVSSVLDKPVSYTGLIEMTAPLCRQPDTVEAIVSILELVDKLQNVHVFVGSKAISSPARLPK
jgi:hypothetical protein